MLPEDGVLQQRNYFISHYNRQTIDRKEKGTLTHSMETQKEELFFYFIFYVKTGEIKQINKKLFKNLKYPVIISHGRKFRVVGCVSRTHTKKVLDTMKYSSWAELEAQGLIGNLFSTVKDLSSIGSILLNSLSKLSTLTRRDLLTIVSSFIKIADMFHSKEFTPLSVTSVVLDIYLVYSSFVIEAQGMECLASLACANFLPDKLFSIIRKSQYLSSVKVLDDLSYFHDFMISVVDAFEWVMNKIPIPLCMKDLVDSLLSMFKNTSDHILIRDLEKLLSQSSDCKRYLDLAYREKSKKLNEKLENSHSLKDWSRRSVSLQTILTKWSRHIKIISAYENPGRVEPTCFIFEGPAGKKKSVVMNAVVEALGEPFYAHCVKAVMDGKDFYDNYNNEPIFYMDDVGQNGVSQWRPLMNMVSSVKLPLDCAEAQNKDTKFFNSSKIFVTTNRFQTLNIALTKQDCIDDIEALWRRGNVFDFSQVECTPSFVRGRIVFKHFDLARKTFVCDFPDNFRKEMIKRGCKLEPYLDIEDRSQLLVWICKIVKIFDLLKRNYANDNKLTQSEKEVIDQALHDLEYLDAQSDFVSSKASYFSEIIQSIITEYASVAIQYTMKLTSFVTENAIHLAAFFSLGIGIAALWWMNTKVEWASEGVRHVTKVENEVMYSVGKEDGELYQFIDPVNSLPSKKFLFKNNSISTNSSAVEKLFKKYRNDKLTSESFKFAESSVHNSLDSIQRSIKNIRITSSEGSIHMRCIISGRSIILPSHATQDDKFSVVVFDDAQLNKRLIDGDFVSVVFRNRDEDIMVCKLSESYPSPFKNLSKWFKEDVNLKETAFLVSSEVVAPVGAFAPQANLSYRTGKSLYMVESAFIYDLQFKGLCGSPVFSPQSGFLGMHVAGSDADNLGVGMAWSQKTRLIIGECLSADKNLLPIDYKTVNSPDSSVVKLDKKMFVSAITKSNIGPSKLHGMYPVNRSPAQLDKFGRFTVKEVGKSAFAVPGKPPLEEVNFASQAVDKMFEDFGDLPWDQVVKGNDLLNGLNKDSSNGFACYPDKSTYIDFEKGTLTAFCREEIEKFENAVESGDMTELDWQKLFWVETPKDEVRNNSKEGVPRTFRVGTIIQQILSKRYFGKFVESVLSLRDFNQVMVGINPIKEWPKIHAQLQKGKIFAGDVAKWDKGMVPEFQRALFETVMEKYKGHKPKVAAIVLECLIHSLVIMLDDLYLTTHSLASGHFLTAIFNSLINRMYTAGWYYRQMLKLGRVPQIYEFFNDVTDFVYGDDKLNSIRRHHDLLNAITMREYFESLGLGFTDSMKNPIENEFQDITEVSFLKRTFRYHDELGKIVCPLELEVLQSGLSWVDYTKDVKLVIDSKIDNYQREIFLHQNRGELLDELDEKLASRGIKLIKFPKKYLLDLYSNDSTYEPIFGSNFVL